MLCIFEFFYFLLLLQIWHRGEHRRPNGGQRREQSGAHADQRSSRRPRQTDRHAGPAQQGKNIVVHRVYFREAKLSCNELWLQFHLLTPFMYRHQLWWIFFFPFYEMKCFFWHPWFRLDPRKNKKYEVLWYVSVLSNIFEKNRKTDDITYSFFWSWF